VLDADSNGEFDRGREKMLSLLLQSSQTQTDSGAAAVGFIFGFIIWLLMFWGLHALAHLLPFPGKDKAHDHAASLPSWHGGSGLLPPAPPS
jgi:hypothetical protein